MLLKSIESGAETMALLLIRSFGADGQPSWKLAPETSVGNGDSEELED
jgi:hypothetical protein